MPALVASSRQTIHADEVEIATEAFGHPSDPPILLVMGAMASMLWWPQDFCRQLAAQGRYVIRYDNRDTGLSTNWEPGLPTYSFEDMADDVVRILDGYGLATAHLAGMSMGGMLAQIAALDHSARISSLVLISTSPVGVETSHLPQMTDAYRQHSAQAEGLDWTDRHAVVDYMVKDMRALAAPALPFDDAAARLHVACDYDRAKCFASATNHFMLKEGEKRERRLTDLRAPLLVIHGTADPIFPVEHGEASAQAVPGAGLLRLEGGGHEMHIAHWPSIITAIVAHT